jgi:hypothetical protein
MLLIMFEPQPKLGVPDAPLLQGFPQHALGTTCALREKVMLLARVLLIVLFFSNRRTCNSR